MLVSAALFTACPGPTAPDSAVCQDVIRRVCTTPFCGQVTTALSVNASNCSDTLLTRTGCGDSAFTFSSPSRTRVLDCRVNLIAEGDSDQDPPTCTDIVNTFGNCPDLVSFLKGGQP